MKIASHNIRLIFIYPSLHKRRVNIQCCNNFLQSAVAAVATIPVTRVLMVRRWINKPAATRPDASDKFMVEATSMVATSINSEFYQWIVVDHDEDSGPTQRLKGLLEARSAVKGVSWISRCPKLKQDQEIRPARARQPFSSRERFNWVLSLLAENWALHCENHF